MRLYKYGREMVLKYLSWENLPKLQRQEVQLNVFAEVFSGDRVYNPPTKAAPLQAAPRVRV